MTQCSSSPATRAVPFALLLSGWPLIADAAESPATAGRFRGEDMVVVGSHLPRPAREVGSAVTVFDKSDIDVRQVSLGSELLKEVPGLAVSRTGQVGSSTQVRIRGAEGNHTLVLIDGIEANDPAFGSEFNFADLLTWDVGRIEVLRGPQSALYGSDAIGGVISVTSIDAEPGLAAHAEVEGGSFGTAQYGATLSGGTAAVRGLLSANRYDTDGISASAIEPERDGYENTTLHGKLDVDLTEQLGARVVIRHSDNAVEGDRQDFDFPENTTQGLVVDSDDRTESAQLYGLVEVDARLLDDRWLHRASFAYTDTESDSFFAGAHTGGTRGERRKFTYETTVLLGGGQHALTGGVQHETLEFSNVSVDLPGANQSEQNEQASVIAEYAWSVRPGASLSVSVRHDDNDRFDDATTLRGTGSYLFEGSNTRLHGSYGQGVTNPSFVELFGYLPEFFVGNPDLEPEKSDGWDLGVEQRLFDDRALIDITYFDSTLEDEIATVFLPTFESTAVNEDGESKRRGVEVTAEADVGESWTLRGTYTYLDASDPGGLEELRRPEHSGSVNVNYRFLGGRGTVNVGALFNGDQWDSEFVNATPQTRVTLDGYTLVNAAISFDVTERLQLFARGENLLDETYTEVFGFRSPGIAGYLGIRARL